MAPEPETQVLLEQILKQLETMRSIPSTALRLREESVDDAVRFIRSDSRFDRAQVSMHNVEALRRALSVVPAWPGLVAEFGVYSGRTIQILARHFPELTVHGFDSFCGLPEDWTGSKEAQGTFDAGGRPPTLQVDNVELHVGWFEDSVPQFARSTTEPFRFVHMDADLYSSTKTVFDHLPDRFVEGTVIVFDEYFGYHGWRHHEHKAFTEFLDETNMTFEAVGIGHMNLAVRLVAER